MNNETPETKKSLKGGDSAIDAIENVFKMEGGLVTHSRDSNLFGQVEHLKVNDSESLKGGDNETKNLKENKIMNEIQNDEEKEPEDNISDEEVSEKEKVESDKAEGLNEEEFDEDHEEESSSSTEQDDDLNDFIKDLSKNKFQFMGGGATESKPSLYVVDHYPFILKQ